MTTDGWIPCAERLPEENEMVLLWWDYGYHLVCRHGDDWTNEEDVWAVSREREWWRRLPPPPEGE